jgi:hypothetical protein
MEGTELDYGKLISGIAVELAKLVMEEIKGRLKRQNNPKKPKRRRTRKKNS